MLNMQIKFFLLLLASTLLSNTASSQTAHLNFSEYGFKVKFHDGAKPVSSGFFLNKGFVKGYEYLRDELNGTIKVRLEIYKLSECYSLRTWEEHVTAYCKLLNNQPAYFPQIKTDGHYDAYGWLTLLCETEKTLNDVQRRMLRAYCSKEYLVALDILMIGNEFTTIAKSLVTDDSAGKPFVSLGIVRKMPEPGIQMKFSGNVLSKFDTTHRCYWYYKCVDTPYNTPTSISA
jgi:hypothetical protein